ncbi:hypothetical protein AAFF_G00227680 [Aldrovandia affinis]|uniref:Shelterin complex subunit TPP1/Est3 domain-containing protein n=1 Tax=Aldrovandia affinis TaxID=143900 RepID=A0AAD7TBM9_9TELE|nr:hypothetical protein AAFF_G00227680 [Aldrovandia affinis]
MWPQGKLKDGVMGKKWRFKIEPWIEAVVQNYSQQESAKPVNGYVLQVCDLSTSDQQEENAVALLSISDGMVQIPTVLSRQAWEVMQKNEERVSVSGLKNSTVVLHQYSLGFQKEAEMSKSKFFIAVNRLAAQAWGAKIEKVPCCTTLPTVRQKICETWRSLEEENPSTTMDTQSGFCLTELLVEWGENCLNDLLEELKGLLAQGPSSSSPQPSTSHAEPLPTAFPTGWHADRVRYRGQETFTVAVSHLYIPAEQMEKMQAQLDNPVTGAANPVEHEEERLGSLPDSGQDGNSLVCSGEEAAVVPVNPWDIFAPAVGNISTSSSEVSPSGSFVSALLPLDQALCDPMATSTPAFGATLERPCSRELFTSSDQSGEGVAATRSDNQTLPPYQRPHPYLTTGSSPILAGSAQSSLGSFVSSANILQHRPSLLLCTPDPCQDKPTAHQQPSSLRRARSELTKTKEVVVAGSSKKCTNVHSAVRTHPDGTPFSYQYQPTPSVAKALSLFEVPDDHVRWAMRYLVSDRSKKPS